VVLFYHFAFLAISIALLGLGAGGVFAHLRKNQLARFDTRALVSRLCFDQCADRSGGARDRPAHSGLPGYFEGEFSSTYCDLSGFRRSVFYHRPGILPGVRARSPARFPLYAADLAGGALACLGHRPLLNWLGGPNTVFFTGVCMALAGTIWAGDSRARKSAAGRALFVLVLIALNYSGKLFDIVYAKGGFRDSAWVEFARWNAISRVEVDTQGQGKAIVIDADASTYLMNVDSKHWQGRWETSLMSAPPALANVCARTATTPLLAPAVAWMSCARWAVAVRVLRQLKSIPSLRHHHARPLRGLHFSSL